VQSVTAVAAEIATSPSTFLFKRPPEEEFLEKIRALVAIIEELAQREDNTSGAHRISIGFAQLSSQFTLPVECEKDLSDSKAKDFAKDIIRLLQAEDARWVSSHASASRNGNVAYPCINIFLSQHVMGKLCSHANRDVPRGTMSLILALVSSLLGTIRYPLLPHQSVHVPLSQLITNAARVYSGASVQHDNEQFAAYKRKIGDKINCRYDFIFVYPSLLHRFQFSHFSLCVVEKVG
jgi:hypothetical protein